MKIAIGPELNGDYVNPADIKLLKQIFGANNVVNYNDPAYKEYSNYWYFYDPAHYNTKVGSKILYDLYRNDKNK